MSAGLAWFGLACGAPPAVWDTGLLGDELRNAASSGLFDMTPYPRLSESQVELIACRWPSGKSIGVGLALTDRRLDWAERAIEALSRGSDYFDLAVLPLGDQVGKTHRELPARKAAPVDIVVREVRIGPGPDGLGDTIASCATGPQNGAVGGVIRGAEISMRTQQPNAVGLVGPISQEDWTGAFLHELGHALGYQGHVRPRVWGVDSVLVREASRLRSLARQALAGRPVEDPVLDSLYRLEPGQVLGRRALSRESRRWAAAIQDVLGPERDLVTANVGDRIARLEGRTASGSLLRLYLPSWRLQLTRGDPIIAIPDAATGQRVSAARPAD